MIANPFVPNSPFPYPLKTPKNRNGVKKGCISNKWVNGTKNSIDNLIKPHMKCYWLFPNVNAMFNALEHLLIYCLSQIGNRSITHWDLELSKGS